MTATLRPIIFARYPVPGRCKTRLIPALGPEGAAGLHRRLVERTLAELASLHPVVAATGADTQAFRDWLGSDVDVVPQSGGDLGARMLAAGTPGPSVIVGSDIPGIDAAGVASAMTLLAGHDLVLGPAEDGGFWLIGWRQPDARLFGGVEWGSARALAGVEANARHLGLATAHADTRADLDRPEDLARWPDLVTP